MNKYDNRPIEQIIKYAAKIHPVVYISKKNNGHAEKYDRFTKPGHHFNHHDYETENLNWMLFDKPVDIFKDSYLYSFVPKKRNLIPAAGIQPLCMIEAWHSANGAYPIANPMIADVIRAIPDALLDIVCAFELSFAETTHDPRFVWDRKQKNWSLLSNVMLYHLPKDSGLIVPRIVANRKILANGELFSPHTK